METHGLRIDCDRFPEIESGRQIAFVEVNFHWTMLSGGCLTFRWYLSHARLWIVADQPDCKAESLMPARWNLRLDGDRHSNGASPFCLCLCRCLGARSIDHGDEVAPVGIPAL